VSLLNKCDVNVDERTATVGPACDGDVLNAAASQHGNLCFPSGHCVGVPLGGFLLGGGLGWYFPHYGYAAEHILQVTLVDAQGNLVVANDQNQEDWMWLARGSASMFPGVVVEFKVLLHPKPTLIRSRTSFFPVDRYPLIVRKFHEHATGAGGNYSDKLELTLNLASTPPPLAEAAGIKDPKLVMVIETWMAESEDEFQQLTKRFWGDMAMDGDLASLALLPLSSLGYEEFDSFQGLSKMLAPAFPPGQHWICRALMYDSSAIDLTTQSSSAGSDIDLDAVTKTFVEEAPLGLSHAMLAWCPKRQTTKPGCYGKYCSKGFVVLVLGVHDGKGDHGQQAQQYVDSMMKVLDDDDNNNERVWKYDALEHPLNRDTFHKSFDGKETREKLLQLREEVDPERLFF